MPPSGVALPMSVSPSLPTPRIHVYQCQITLSRSLGRRLFQLILYPAGDILHDTPLAFNEAFQHTESLHASDSGENEYVLVTRILLVGKRIDTFSQSLSFSFGRTSCFVLCRFVFKNQEKNKVLSSVWSGLEFGLGSERGGEIGVGIGSGPRSGPNDTMILG